MAERRWMFIGVFMAGLIGCAHMSEREQCIAGGAAGGGLAGSALWGRNLVWGMGGAALRAAMVDRFDARRGC